MAFTLPAVPSVPNFSPSEQSDISIVANANAASAAAAAKEAAAIAADKKKQADILTQAKKDVKAQANERLYQVSPRNSSAYYNGDSQTQRGDTASIRLLNSNNMLEGRKNTSNRFNAIAGNVNDSTVFNDLIGIGGGNGTGYDRFILSDFSVSYSEKVQIMTTFGDNEVVYYFGKNPVVMNFSGMLIDSLTNNWFGNFINLYQTFLRGTQLAKNFEMLEIVLPNMKIIGSIIALSHQQNSSRDTDIPFSFQFYAKQIIMLPQPVIGQYGYEGSIQKGTGIFSTPSISRSTQGASASSGSSPSTVSINGSVYNVSGSTGGFTEPGWMSNSGSLTGIGGTLATDYKWFRNNLVSPAVSVIASLTKVVQIVSKDISKIVSSFTNPLNSVLSDVMNISIQVTSVAVLVENSVSDISKNIGTVSTNLRNTLASLKSTAGVVSRLPESVSDIFKRNVHHGRIGSSSAVLSSGSSSTTKAAVLNSGIPHTAQNSFTIK